MTAQDAKDILEKYEKHPNRGVLLFKIKGEWLTYYELSRELQLHDFLRSPPTLPRTIQIYTGKGNLDLLDNMLKQE